MSSPPTPSTSIKAAPLRPTPRKHHQRSSFPSVAILNPFRKKPPRKTSRTPSPVEPYEVAPGIWNTDATAKVFGYLESTGKKGKSQGKAGGSLKRNLGQPPQRKPIPHNRTSKDSGAEARGPASETIVELPGQPVDGHVMGIRDIEMEARKAAGKENPRTVCRDDQLVQRGANPRTGLVSPFVFSDSSDDNLSHDFVKIGRAQKNGRPSSKGRSRSGKWKQQGAEWTIVESPILSPIAQSINGPLSRKVSLKQLEDKLLVEMPGVDNPEPGNLTDEQIRRYQDDIARAYKHGGDNAMVDPGTLPSPRHTTPDGPSTPPNKLQRIRRKMVGSTPAYRDGSNDSTVISERKCTSSAPNPKKNKPESPTVIKTNSVGISREPLVQSQWQNSSINKGDSFLGQMTVDQSGQMKCKTYISPLRTTLQYIPQSDVSNGAPHWIETDCVNPHACPTLRQCLPQLNIPHPNHFRNLETSSYRRPAQLLPERLRPMDQRRQIIEDAYTTIITSTSSPEQGNEQMLKMRKQDESVLIPKAIRPSILKSEITKENYLQAGTPRKKPLFDTKHTADASGSSTMRQHATELPKQYLPEEDMAGMRHRSPAFLKHRRQGNGCLLQPAERGARVAMIEDYRNRVSPQDQSQERSSMVLRVRDTKPGNAKIAQSPTQGKFENGDGITHMSGRHGRGYMEHRYDDNQVPDRKAFSTYRASREPRAPVRIAPSPDSSFVLADQPIKLLPNQGGPKKVVSEPKEAAGSNPTIVRRATKVEQPSYALIGSLQTSAKLSSIQRCVYRMACYVARTLHPASPAFTALRSPRVSAHDYLIAAKEIILAAWCLLLLLILFLALRKMLMFLSVMLYWIWHPVRMVFAILRWCIAA